MYNNSANLSERVYSGKVTYRRNDAATIPHSGKLPYLLASALVVGAVATSSCNESTPSSQRETSVPVTEINTQSQFREPYRLLGMQTQLPDGWTIMPDIVLDNGKVINANNFQSKYLHGGILPPGGAEITLIADASIDFLPSIDTLVSEFIDGDKNVKQQDISIKGAPCSARQVESDSEFTPTFVYRRVAVFLPLRHKSDLSPVVYKVFLTYHAFEDQKTQQSFNDTFSRLLESLVIVEPAECEVRLRV